MKTIYLLFIFLLFSLLTFGQDRFLTVTSKDSINDRPKFKSSLGINMKLNGFYDVFGGLQGSDTFNVGLIDVFGTDDSSSFQMDMYQTQIKLESSFTEKNGDPIYTMVEFDFWGGNGKLRLRKAYVQTGHWQIGQNWNNFGDEVLWPNIMEWEGPPSGIWVRTPHIKYFNTFKNENWIYEISLEAPINNYIGFPELDFDIEEVNQVTPDLTFAIKKRYNKGHVRLSSILRNVRYNFNDQLDNFIGYGFSLSGVYTTEKRNMLQFQFVGGKGITAYMTSISGLGFDGYPNINGNFDATPAFGGWISYEYFFTPKLHSNIVLGLTNYDFKDMEEFILIREDDLEEFVVQGDFFNTHYYGLLNLMYEPYKRMTIGLELDYGVKNIDLNGFIDNNFVDINKDRDAMRISFGFMFYL